MIFDFSMGKVAGFAVMAIFTIPFFPGTLAYRWTVWLLAWQLLTPTRAWWFDILLIGLSFGILEWTYGKANALCR